MKSISEIKAAIDCPVPSISTPFLENGDIDWRSLDRIVDFLIENGAKALLVTNGDSLLSVLTDQETAELNRRVIKAAKGRALIMAGGKPWGGAQALEFAGFLREIGSDVYLPMIPDWAQSTSSDQCADLLRKAGQIMPVMALTNLGNGRGIPLSVFSKLIEEGAHGFMGVKDDMCGPYGRRLAALLDGRYAFLSGGRAENHLDVAPYRPDGYLSIFMRFLPNLAWGYWKRYCAGDYHACARWIMRYEVRFMDFIAKEGIQFDMAIHALMSRAGLCEKWRRMPYESADDAQEEALARLWEELTAPEASPAEG